MRMISAVSGAPQQKGGRVRPGRLSPVLVVLSMLVGAALLFPVIGHGQTPPPVPVQSPGQAYWPPSTMYYLHPYAVYQRNPFAYLYDAYDLHPRTFYTADGRSVVHYPNGLPRHSRRRYAGPIMAPVVPGPGMPGSVVTSPNHFQGPYWHHIVFRRSRGLFHRSAWQATVVPYYVAPAADYRGYVTTVPFPYSVAPNAAPAR